jgi:preprotein translocase subunit SecE
MNRQLKRQMAKQGGDRPRAPQPRTAPPPHAERTGPRQYLREVSGEFRKVAWPTRSEVLNSTIIVVIGVVVMTAIIFAFDWTALNLVDLIYG